MRGNAPFLKRDMIIIDPDYQNVLAFQVSLYDEDELFGTITKCVDYGIGGGKGGAMGLQPHLILRVLHRIFIFYHRNIFFSVS